MNDFFDILGNVLLYFAFGFLAFILLMKIDNNYEKIKNKCESLGGIYTHDYCVDKNSNILLEDFYIEVEKWKKYLV